MPETVTRPETPTRESPITLPDPDRHPEWDPRRLCPDQRREHLAPELP